MGIVRFYVRAMHLIERIVLNLDYEVRGIENLPKTGSYLVAAKHQSTYETLKLHLIFDDPAIILKKELLNIPIWGWFLKRIDPIAIDRKNSKSASKQIISGAKEVMQKNRPIIIFPQGTRVHPDQTTADKPYKIGVVKMQEATGMPIIPLAINSGKFWPRDRWLKKPGTVIFAFLPPLTLDSKRTSQETIKTLETKIEEASTGL